MSKDDFISDIFLIFAEKLNQPMEVIELFDSLSQIEKVSIVYRLFELICDDCHFLTKVHSLFTGTFPVFDEFRRSETEHLLSALAVGSRPNTTSTPSEASLHASASGTSGVS